MYTDSEKPVGHVDDVNDEMIVLLLLVAAVGDCCWLSLRDGKDKTGDGHCGQGAARGRWKLYAPDSSCFVDRFATP